MARGLVRSPKAMPARVNVRFSYSAKDADVQEWVWKQRLGVVAEMASEYIAAVARGDVVPGHWKHDLVGEVPQRGAEDRSEPGAGHGAVPVPVLAPAVRSDAGQGTARPVEAPVSPVATVAKPVGMDRVEAATPAAAVAITSGLASQDEPVTPAAPVAPEVTSPPLVPPAAEAATPGIVAPAADPERPAAAPAITKPAVEPSGVPAAEAQAVAPPVPSSEPPPPAAMSAPNPATPAAAPLDSGTGGEGGMRRADVKRIIQQAKDWQKQ